MPEEKELGSWLIVFTHDQSALRMEIDREPVLDAALTAYVDSGKTRDTLLQFTCVSSGEPAAVLASHITGWERSTPAGRAREAEFDAAVAAELPRFGS